MLRGESGASLRMWTRSVGKYTKEIRGPPLTERRAVAGTTRASARRPSTPPHRHRIPDARRSSPPRSLLRCDLPLGVRGPRRRGRRPAGHFVMLRLHEAGAHPAHRRRLSIAEAGTITTVVQALGKTTREMLATTAAGDTFPDFVGPLGLPPHVDKVGHVVLVGGGLGVAPVYRSSAPSRRRETGSSASLASGSRTSSSGRRSSGSTATS